MNRWWLGFPAAQASIPCGEHSHRLRWEAGELTALDHGDLEAESALAALGGERCTCVEVIEAWRRHQDDPRVLVIASRGPADPIAADGEWAAQLAATPALTSPPPPSPAGAISRKLFRRRGAPPGTPHQVRSRPVVRLAAGTAPFRTQAENELLGLLGLGGGLPDRLVASVAAAWAERLADPGSAVNGALPALHASMHGRLAAAVRSWLGRADAAVELELVDARQTPVLRESAGVIRAELPFGWLPEVWSRGVGTVMGRFCLAARTDDGRAWTLTTVGPELGPPAPLRIELPAAY
jgi:hypothetical protein